MLSFLYVYSDHSILECYNLFSGVELSMRSFFVIIREKTNLAFDMSVDTNVEQGLFFRMPSGKMSIVSETLKIFHFS